MSRAIEHERIYLEPLSNVDPHGDGGRQWCQDNVWPDDDCDEPGIEYVRADLLAAAIAATREECAAICDALALTWEREWADADAYSEVSLMLRASMDAAKTIAAAIRAGGEG